MRGELRGLQVIQSVRRVDRNVVIATEQSDEVWPPSLECLGDISVVSKRKIIFGFQATQKEVGHFVGHFYYHFLLCAALGILWNTSRCFPLVQTR